MALRNGLLVHGPTHWAAAIRAARRRDRGRLGPQAARCAAALDARARRARRRPPRRGDGRHPARQARAARGAAAVPGRDASLGADGARRRVGGVAAAPARRGAGGEAALAALSLLPSLVALRGGDLAAYHGVEHKAIGAYEQDAATRATRPRSTTAAARTSWRRCSPPTSPAPRCCAASSSARRRWPAAPSQLASLGAAVEVFAWSERHARHRAGARAAPPRATSCSACSGTREPTEEQLEVGRAALAEILRAERRRLTLAAAGWRIRRLPIHRRGSCTDPARGRQRRRAGTPARPGGPRAACTTSSSR